MPKSNLDWLGIASLWIGALVMALKAGGLPLMGGAPAWFASPVWGSVPLVLISVYLIIAIARIVRPHSLAAKVGPQPSESAGVDAAAAVREKRQALESMTIAKGQARTALSRSTVIEAEKEWPRMHAALLSANKLFGIPIPPAGYGAILDLECGRRLLEKVIPLLAAGHGDGARQVAETFVENLKPSETSPPPV